MPGPIQDDWMNKLAFAFAFILVLMGMLNNLPTIPGALELVRSIPGLTELPRISKYNSEFFFPLTFFLMTAIALLRASFARDYRDQSSIKYFSGISLDLLMLVATSLFCIFYLVENEQVCLIDTLNGDRARAMAENLSRAKEYLEIFGTEPDDDYPDCITNGGMWVMPFLVVAVSIFFIYIVKVWGFPIVAVAIIISLYTVISSIAWYF